MNIVLLKDRPRRVTRLSGRFRLNYMVSFVHTVAEDIVDFEPRNYKEAWDVKIVRTGQKSWKKR